MTLTALVVCALAAWRVAHLLVNERGPFAIGEIVRGLFGVRQVKGERTVGIQTYTTTECQGDNEVARMLCCIYCTSVWTSALAAWFWIIGTAITPSFAEALVDWFAIATLCIVVEKVNRYL
jgi:hypothetical protein